MDTSSQLHIIKELALNQLDLTGPRKVGAAWEVSRYRKAGERWLSGLGKLLVLDEMEELEGELKLRLPDNSPGKGWETHLALYSLGILLTDLPRCTIFQRRAPPGVGDPGVIKLDHCSQLPVLGP
jgi:hypothetical protein